MESELIKGFTPVEIDPNQYYDRHDFISYSGLKRIKISPAHFMFGEKGEPSEAMEFGSAYHSYILEPEKFEQEYYVFDDHFICETLIAEGAKSPRATKAYKEWEESENRLIGDKKVITIAQFNIIKEMKEVLMHHYYCKALLMNGKAEFPITGTLQTEIGDINIKAKPDFVKEKYHFIVDLKTCADASAEMFTKSAADADYHIQAALYCDLMEMLTGDGMSWNFYFIAQEKKKPYAFNIFEASPQFISQGRYEYEQLLRLYKMCQETGKWPGYQVFCKNKSGAIELNLPPRSIKKIDFYDHITKK